MSTVIAERIEVSGAMNPSYPAQLAGLDGSKAKDTYLFADFQSRVNQAVERTNVFRKALQEALSDEKFQISEATTLHALVSQGIVLARETLVTEANALPLGNQDGSNLSAEK